MPLPTAKTPPKLDLANLNMLIYGAPKIGKSTFCSNADEALFIATEAGLNSLDVYQVRVSTWAELLATAKDVADTEHKFKTIVVDTIDNAYRMCLEHVCALNKIQHPSDLDYGKGYGLVNNEFTRVLTKLSLLPQGLILVSHAQDKEMQTRTGKVMKTIPTLPDAARKIVLGMADMILYADVEIVPNGDGKPTTRRVLRTKPAANYEAGDRTGRLPEVLDLDYRSFLDAFTKGASSDTNPPANGKTRAAAAR